MPALRRARTSLYEPSAPARCCRRWGNFSRLVNRLREAAGLHGAVVNRLREAAGLDGGVVNRLREAAGLDGAVVNRLREAAGLDGAVVNRLAGGGRGRRRSRRRGSCAPGG